MSQQVDDSDLEGLVNDVIHGDRNALAKLFDHYRDRLWRIVQFRMDRRLVGRVDADDVLQEAYLDAEKRIEHFLHDSPESFFIWLRLIVNQTLIDVHRRHLGTQARDASRERSLSGGWSAESTSFSLSHHLLGEMTSPSQAALKAELAEQLNLALEGMGHLDREVLALRHFEELTNSETARALGISEQAASLRYVRAISRLRKILEALPGFRDRFPK
ncbi:sigma-70 family RNA polymerase sigma factor [Planctomicrobium piriforme]|uniref:RNA polymerase sigma-70 factor, ECF subfamily n=1 Tax=Planctomicrobium piriforme TaxID=1576369 RepID=A0A1I3IHS6_9PLAN|nr:sigma-70 family RNA polymerase sigma factor [Planctomicrobium piriforme]SFI47409.1 RNA polymerase sigma-70 factor, ECF subfamily [Planctomicrobium piriforme]